MNSKVTDLSCLRSTVAETTLAFVLDGNVEKPCLSLIIPLVSRLELDAKEKPVAMLRGKFDG